MKRRHKIIDEQFAKIKNFLPGCEESSDVTAKDNLLFVKAFTWIFETGSFWRDLPKKFDKWSSVHRRFSRWSSSGAFDKIFCILSASADMEFLLMDGTIVKVHQHAAGAKKKKSSL